MRDQIGCSLTNKNDFLFQDAEAAFQIVAYLAMKFGEKFLADFVADFVATFCSYLPFGFSFKAIFVALSVSSGWFSLTVKTCRYVCHISVEGLEGFIVKGQLGTPHINSCWVHLWCGGAEDFMSGVWVRRDLLVFRCVEIRCRFVCAWTGGIFIVTFLGDSHVGGHFRVFFGSWLFGTSFSKRCGFIDVIVRLVRFVSYLGHFCIIFCFTFFAFVEIGELGLN